MTEEIGQKKVEELKPGGKDIPVDDKNKIEYIHHMADYKLNKQIKAQCNAFRQSHQSTDEHLPPPPPRLA